MARVSNYIYPYLNLRQSYSSEFLGIMFISYKKIIKQQLLLKVRFVNKDCCALFMNEFVSYVVVQVSCNTVGFDRGPHKLK